MPAQIIDGKAVSADIREEVKTEIARLKQKEHGTPGLAVILVGDDPASAVYVRNKNKACEQAGIFSITRKLPATTSEEQLLREIGALNHDKKFHGLLVQLPLPDHIDTQKIIEAVAPHKDVDCFHPYNVGRLMIGQPVFEPATPAGIMELLLRYGVETSGKHVVILGRSNIVGKPLANLLVQKKKGANAVVTVLHSAVREPSQYTRRADILIAAMGRPEAVRGEMVKPGAVVIDVGINRVDAPENPRGYRLAGDVAFSEVAEVAGLITPVPGGVGPMTIAMLLRNTLKAFQLQQPAGG